MAVNLISERLPNGLKGCIDWLSWTFGINCGMSPSEVVLFLGFDVSDFLELPRGANGYKNMMLLNGYNIRILYEGNSNMGIHVDVSGSAIFELVNSWKQKKKKDNSDGFKNEPLLSLLNTLSKIATFTRIDLAVDDIGCQYYSCDDVVRLIENQQIVSKFREYDNKVPRSIIDGEKLGHTIYLGSNKSDIKLRIYDKRLEQLNKHKTDCGCEWIRWELELKKERADQAVRQLLDYGHLSIICIGILSHYLRFIINDNPNRSRCSIEWTWKKFIDDMKRMSLYIPSAPKNIEDTRRWINDCVGASISAVIEFDGGSMDFFYANLLQWQSKRMNNKELTARLIRSEQENSYEASRSV